MRVSEREREREHAQISEREKLQSKFLLKFSYRKILSLVLTRQKYFYKKKKFYQSFSGPENQPDIILQANTFQPNQSSQPISKSVPKCFFQNL